MEWIVTTGRSVEEAKEMALDQLGVAEEDAEFEILEEAKPGLFGRFRKEVRVRARVQPVQPRPKTERRRKRSSASAGRQARRAGEGTTKAPAKKKAARQEGSGQEGRGQGRCRRARPPGARPARPRRAAAPAADSGSAADDTGAAGAKGDPVSDVEIPLSEHAEQTRSFVEGLLDAFGLDAAAVGRR